MQSYRVSLYLAGLLLMAVILFPAASYESVSGTCTKCHTMHSSEGGTAVKEGPSSGLLRDTCLGCHATTGSNPRPNDGSIFIQGNFSDDNCLAGGYYPWPVVAGPGEVLSGAGGSCHPLGSNKVPIGYQSDWYGRYSGRKLSCAGDSGCHGDQKIPSYMEGVDNQILAIRGGHHLKLNAAPDAYRMLIRYEHGAQYPVAGIGAGDYEKSLIAGTTVTNEIPVTNVLVDKNGDGIPESATTYNVYSAGNIPGKGTISQFCANCHGNHHGAATGSQSPWIRHPTEVQLRDDWILAKNDLTYRDCKYNPVGFENVAVPGRAKHVICVSCHRAHGTGQHSLLRFPFSDQMGDQGPCQQASGNLTYGCCGCHSRQR